LSGSADVRIIAGQWKGRRLAAPAAGIRPTSDQLRETLFNVIRDRVSGATMLDGFAGTGAVGLEALSRGAAHVTFVERERAALAVLMRNVATVGADETCMIVRGGFVQAVERGLGRAPFDLVFLDPPYDAEDLQGAVEQAAIVTRAGGLIVLEHSRRTRMPDTLSGATRARELVAGDSALSFFETPGIL
jgi:16S rRNA (guanine(966)-N(2))-methyltransferase RsmD